MTLEQDSPLISEWLDGRLSADQADDVAAAVRAKPELTELAAQLRRLKTVLTEAGDQPVMPGPSLVSAVMSALEGELPGDEDPLEHAAANGDSALRPPHDDTD
jgi:anti-sigma factor RsiW